MSLPALDLRHLALVEAVVEERTLTQAARRLALTQSAASQQLKEAERRLGAPLFERVGRGLVLAPAGEAVLGAARVALGALRRAEDDIRAIADGRVGVLRLSTECYTAYHWLPAFLGRFGEAFPGVDVEVRPEATLDPATRLRERALDVAILVDAETAGTGLAVTPLFDDEAVALVPANHPWAGRPHVRAADFATERLLVMREPERDALTTRVLRPARVVPVRTVRVPAATEAITESVRAGLGVAVMARWAAAPYLNRGGLAAVRVTEDGLWRRWSAATRDEAQPRFVGAFVELLAALRPCAETGILEVPDGPSSGPGG